MKNISGLKTHTVAVLLSTAFIAGGCTLATSKPMQAEPEMAEPAEPTTKIVQKEVVLNARTLFEFDSARLSSSGEQAIRDLIDEAKGEAANGITVTGHTDPIGTEEYNMDLSKRRAESVAEYMQSLGVPASSIRTVAMGESELVVRCEGKRGDALIECLQPNRRVVVQYPVMEETEVMVEDEESMDEE